MRYQYILDELINNSAQWNDWHWHIRNTVRSIDKVEALLGITFSPTQRQSLQDTIAKFPLAITPYYLSLVNTEDPLNDPIFRQAFPSPHELIIYDSDMVDPLSEDKDSPAPGITHRYPDRVLFHISNICAMYCRHCTRKRKVGDKDSIPGQDQIQQAINYIASNNKIRDVLLSGGDPFMLSDEYLEYILEKVSAIPHIEIIRIGTRMPVVLPYRITDKLVTMLKKYQPLWINTHFNHPRELTKSSIRAIRKLADGGIPLGNQSVLLAGVNDCARIIKDLCHKLVANRVRPYYLYQCDLSEGLNHFRTPIGKGIEIIESMIGHTTGFAVPNFVVDSPGGGGKIRLTPNYLLSWSTHKVVLRNYEGMITTYQEPLTYEPVFCDRNCPKCNLSLDLNPSDEHNTIGIEKLLSDHDTTISLVPQENERIERRNDDDNS